MATSTNADILATIISRSEDLLKDLDLPHVETCRQLKSPHSSGLDAQNNVSEFELDPPVDISAALLDVGCPPDLCEELSRICVSRISELRKAYQTIMSETCEGIVTSPSIPGGVPHTRLAEKTREVFTHRYEGAIQRCKESLLKVVKDHLASSAVDASTLNEDANSCEEWIDDNEDEEESSVYYLLESLFQRGIQMPRRHEKALLSEKTGLTYRQVGVWFQNRRERERSDTKFSGSYCGSRPLDIPISFESASYPSPQSTSGSFSSRTPPSPESVPEITMSDISDDDGWSDSETEVDFPCNESAGSTLVDCSSFRSRSFTFSTSTCDSDRQISQAPEDRPTVDAPSAIAVTTPLPPSRPASPELCTPQASFGGVEQQQPFMFGNIGTPSFSFSLPSPESPKTRNCAADIFSRPTTPQESATTAESPAFSFNFSLPQPASTTSAVLSATSFTFEAPTPTQPDFTSKLFNTTSSASTIHLPTPSPSPNIVPAFHSQVEQQASPLSGRAKASLPRRLPTSGRQINPIPTSRNTSPSQSLSSYQPVLRKTQPSAIQPSTTKFTFQAPTTAPLSPMTPPQTNFNSFMASPILPSLSKLANASTPSPSPTPIPAFTFQLDSALSSPKPTPQPTTVTPALAFNNNTKTTATAPTVTHDFWSRVAPNYFSPIVNEPASPVTPPQSQSPSPPETASPRAIFAKPTTWPSPPTTVPSFSSLLSSSTSSAFNFSMPSGTAIKNPAPKLMWSS